MTVVDDLILRFSLDPTNFNRGQQQAIASLQKLEEEARKSGGAVEDSAKKMADGFERVTKEVLSLGAAFLGVNGLKDLAVSTVQTAANLGVLATATNTSSEALNRWQNAARHVGIGADQTGAAISGLIVKLQQFQAHQITPEGLGLRAMQSLTNNGITQADLQPENVENLLLKLAKGVKANPSRAAGLTAEIPGGSALLPLLQRQDLEALLARSQSITNEQIAAAQRIRDIFVDTAIKIETAVNKLLPSAEGPAAGIGRGIGQLAEGDPRGFLTIDSNTGSGALGRWIGQHNPFISKPDAGNFNEGTAALSAWISQNVGGFNQITAANDAYHGGRGGHGAGLAVDFTLNKGASAEQYALTAAGLNRSGLGLKAINEFAPGSSAGWTAPHMHVQFRDREAAEAFARDHPSGGDTKNVTNNITVHTQPGADAHAIGAAVGHAVNAPEAQGGAQ